MNNHINFHEFRGSVDEIADGAANLKELIDQFCDRIGKMADDAESEETSMDCKLARWLSISGSLAAAGAMLEVIGDIQDAVKEINQ